MRGSDKNVAPCGSSPIWHYYQNVAPESFQAARPRLDFIVRQIARHCRSLSTPQILNIGIGNGHLEKAAQSRGWVVHSLDPDPPSCERIAALGIHAHAGTVQNIPLGDATLDAVVASEVLEHLTDPERRDGLAEIARVLKPGGWFMGTVPDSEELKLGHVVCPRCGTVFHRWGHVQSFDLRTIATQLILWFDVECVRRTAFVSFGDRNMVGKLKSLARLVLAKCGQPIAVPTIYWSARKRVVAPKPKGIPNDESRMTKE
jgi:2-polyprenyl-3-methyl-5-hydroxy-6-metoxy-1,4-benzoquinol methylase